ncbi:unnamed protein product [Brassica oleracea var. botrytis]|uniref:EF-hand domain-containing protein n=3 Tax=Brassica TaxID=3705 RepID=A0ABQ7CK60_BRACR|nr:hypothetical protein DY000_02003086 [Brassica cretica]KAG2295402.1 hypothetical protein Bca52824_042071 [Brassica carinata]CAF1702433.1 unnamed protein product [Brassica napus]CDY21261.1 BnaC03g29450D [Brassica napus]
MYYVEVFKRMDKNKDGKISLDEFSEGIRAFSSSITSEQIDELFKDLDVDGDGQIDVKEFAMCFVVGRD